MNFDISIKKYKNIDPVICEVHYGGHKRYLKTIALPELNIAINAWILQNAPFNPAIELKPDNNYIVNIDETKATALIELFNHGVDTKAVHLPSSLEKSVEGNPVFYSYHDLNDYVRYWLSEGKTPSLYTLLSTDILENPYADEPVDYDYRFAKVAFHSNHGTGHALRSTILMHFFYVLITNHTHNEYGDNCVTIEKAIHPSSREEKACLELACFLFRAGRTNEFSWEGDPTYSPRSAIIFKQIALELGFQEGLVNMIANAFDYKCERPASQEKFYQKLLQLCHACDLIRCNTNKQFLLQEIVGTLGVVSASTRPHDLVEKVLYFSRSLCIETGATVACEFTPSGATKNNPYKIVASANEVSKTFLKLNEMRESFQRDLMKEDKPIFTQAETQKVVDVEKERHCRY